MPSTPASPRASLTPQRGSFASGGSLSGLVLSALSGAWRQDVSPLPLSKEELEAITPLLMWGSTGALVWRRIRNSPLAGSRAAGALRRAYYFARINEMHHRTTLTQVMPILRSVRAEPLLVKGLAVGRYYAEPGIRLPTDIDLYVEPAAWPAAHAALKDLPKAIQHQIDLQPGTPRLEDRDRYELLRRLEWITVDSIRVQVLGPEDHLRLLCLHLFHHGARRALWVCDVAAALEAAPADFDWTYFYLGDAWRTQAVRGVLGLVQEVFGADLMVNEGTPAFKPPPRWLVDSVLRNLRTISTTALWLAPFSVLTSPHHWLTQLRQRWPDPIAATLRCQAPFDDRPRLPFQIIDYLWRAILAIPRDKVRL